METLSTKINGAGGVASQTYEKKKARPGLHVCAHCKQEVYHNKENCLDLEANKVKRYPGWKSVFAKE